MSNTVLPPAESRPRTLVTGAVLGSITSVMFFAGLFAMVQAFSVDLLSILGWSASLNKFLALGVLKLGGENTDHALLLLVPY